MHQISVSMFQKLKNIFYVYVNSLFYETFIETSLKQHETLTSRKVTSVFQECFKIEMRKYLIFHDQSVLEKSLKQSCFNNCFINFGLQVYQNSDFRMLKHFPEESAKYGLVGISHLKILG